MFYQLVAACWTQHCLGRRVHDVFLTCGVIVVKYADFPYNDICNGIGQTLYLYSLIQFMTYSETHSFKHVLLIKEPQ